MKHRFNPEARGVLPGVFRFAMAYFLGGLALLIFLAPFLAELPQGRTLEAGLMTLVLCFAVMAVGHKRQTLWQALGLLVPVVAGRWLHHFFPDLVPAAVFLAGAMVFVVFIIWQLLRYILRAPRVDSEIVCAGIATYVLLALLWAFAYMLVANTVKNAFMLDGQATSAIDMTTFSSMYFSLITLTTVGYGDIIPNCSVARMLASLEAVTGTLFMAVLISRLVSLYSVQPREEGK